MKIEHLFPIICAISVFNCVECSNILAIFTSPGKSHTILGTKLAEGLVKRGHHVTLACPHPVSTKENLTIIHLKSILEFREQLEKSMNFSPTANKITTTFSMMNAFLKANDLFWEEPGIQKIIKEKPKYDVVILVNFFNDAILGIGHHLGVPTIIFSCVGSNPIGNRYVANPDMPYVSNFFLSKSADGFFGRLMSVSMNALVDFLTDTFVDPHQEELLKKYLPHAPPLQELKQNIALMLMNSHFSIEPPRPYVPNMIQIGGFHLQDTTPLAKDFKDYLDAAKQGAILFSMGSNVQVGNFEEKQREVIINALGEMAPMKVIFKSELQHKDMPKNMLVSNWVPQADILAHPNLKAFISHGGLGGNTEAVYHGVPIVGIPFLGDQKMNMGEAESAGYAVVVHYEKIVDEFKSKLKEVIEDPKYSQNAKKRSALIKEQPVKPMDNAAFWIEHIIKYGGGSHLRNAGMYLAWYQFYMVDIYVFYTVVLCLSLIINYYMIKLFLRIMKRLFFNSNIKVKTS